MTWDIDKADACMWIASEAAKSLVGSMEKECGIRFTKHLCHVVKHKFRWCCTEEENERVGNFLVEKFKDSKFVEKFVKDYKKFDIETIKELNELDRKDFSKFSDEELFEVFKRTNFLYTRNFDWSFIMEPMDFVMPNMIEKPLIELDYTPNEISDMMAIPDFSYVHNERIELIRIAKQNDLDKLKQHAFKWRWMRSAHMGRIDIPFEEFMKGSEKLNEKNPELELQKIIDMNKNIENRKKELIKKKPINDETKKLLEITKIIAPLHDRRKELFLRTIYSIDTARIEIAKRYNYTINQLSTFEVEDIIKLKENKNAIDKNEADKRFKECLLMIDTKKNQWEYFHGKEASKIASKELDRDFDEIDEFHGMIASPGNVTGPVRILYGLKDMDKVQKGDVIVTSMTKPEFIPALRKAAAIITEEGGVTCHAAIVSRELGVPCIIGTKIAMHVLKEGDIVEVDADNGFVRKK